MGKYDDYRKQIESWNWAGIRDDALENVRESHEPYGEDYGTTFLGTVFALTPSGKYYMPWACSNVTEEEAYDDADWFSALEAVADSYGMWIESGEGDPCDIFVCIAAPDNDEEE